MDWSQNRIGILYFINLDRWRPLHVPIPSTCDFRSHSYSSFSFLHHYGCHQHWFCPTEWGSTSTEATMSGDNRSYNFFYSILFYFFFLHNWWCDPWGHHEVALADATWLWLSSRLSHWWDVSTALPLADSHGKSCSFSLSFSKGLAW